MLDGTIELPLVGTVSKKIALIAAVVALVILIVIVAGIRGCVRGQASSASSAAVSSASAAASSASANAEGGIQRSALESILGAETAQQLIDQAESNEDARWIVTHVDAYAFEGDTVQEKILRLAAIDPLSIPYVRHFPDRYPADDQNLDDALAVNDGLSGTSFDTRVPHLYQWDPRWAYCDYSSTTFGLTGCGPTCMAMVSRAVGGSSLTPWDMAVRARDNGFMAQYNGTDTNFFYTEAATEGFSCWEIPVTGEGITAALSAGQVVIANLSTGYFTQFGHFFVLTGLDGDGNVIVNDPYSVVRSSQTWEPSFIAGEAIGLYVFA